MKTRTFASISLFLQTSLDISSVTMDDVNEMTRLYAHTLEDECVEPNILRQVLPKIVSSYQPLILTPGIHLISLKHPLSP